MPGDLVVDASVLARILFAEPGAQAARAVLSAATGLIAPDLIHFEIASVAAKRCNRQLSTLAEADGAVRAIAAILDETVPGDLLAPRALELAIRHQISAYDASYVALADLRAAVLVTGDLRLAARCQQGGLGHLIQALP